MFRILKKEKGSATIEASISLTLFIYFIVTIYSVIDFCRAQALIGNAINQAAKEMSQYSYFYKLSGLQKYETALEDKTKDTKLNIDDFIGATDDLFKTMGKDADTTTGNVQSLLESKNIFEAYLNANAAADDAKGTYTDINGKVKDVTNKFETLFSDPKGLMIGMAAIAGQQSLETGKSRLIAAPLAKMLSKKHLELSGKTADERLRSLGVVDGLDGLNFNLSTIFPKGQNDIKITVIYRVKTIQLLPIKSEAVFCQTANTRGWLSGDVEPTLMEKINPEEEEAVDPDEGNDNQEEQSTVWDKAPQVRGKEIVASEELKLTSYKLTKNLKDCHGYSSGNNEFVYITSINPFLTSYEGTKLASEITKRTNSFKDSVSSSKTVTLANGTTINTPTSGINYTMKLVVPDNADMERIKSLLDSKGMYNGVKVEIVTGYGSFKTDAKG